MFIVQCSGMKLFFLSFMYTAFVIKGLISEPVCLHFNHCNFPFFLHKVILMC